MNAANDGFVAKRALVSVSDKSGLVAFAKALRLLGIDILSTSGTRRMLAEAGVDVIDIAAVTGFPEIMAGRVKTLHPKLHGGILARRDADAEAMAEHGIEPIDLVAVNLYPFERTIADPGRSFAEAVENIDIGGPAMLRSAAKNHLHVLAVVDPNDYPMVAEALRQGSANRGFRQQLAAKAFAHTATYDRAIAGYLGGSTKPPDEEAAP